MGALGLGGHGEYFKEVLVYDLTMAYTRREESGCTQRAAQACCREHVSPRSRPTICIHSGLDSANFMCGYASSSPSTGPNSFIDCLQPAARSVRARGQRRHDACHLLITCQVPAAGRCSHLLKQLGSAWRTF